MAASAQTVLPVDWSGVDNANWAADDFDWGIITGGSGVIGGNSLEDAGHL